MSKYYEIACHHLIGSYGGIGSIIETQDGSMIVQDLEKWPFYIYKIKDKDEGTIQSLSVRDPRLIRRLKSVFPKLKYLIKIPTNSTSQGGYRVGEIHNLISAEYFPQWMFCPICGLFMRFSDWDKRHRNLRISEKFRMFCPDCKKNKNRNVMLDQVRFIQVTKSGDIRDIDWLEWFEQNRFSTSDCPHSKLKYSNATDIDNLNSIKLSCVDCNDVATLKGIFSVSNEEQDYITILKTSNSAYFPQIIKSLVIPCDTDTNDYEITEFEYRCRELDYMRNHEVEDDDELSISLKKMECLYGFIDLTSIRSLDITGVLCSYSRIDPVSQGTIFEQGKSKHVSENGADTLYLPSVKFMGEGFLLDFDDKEIKKSFSRIIQIERFKNRIKHHRAGLTNYNLFHDAEPSLYLLYKYTLLHSISHILIKQMESECGYPASSINERIYCSEGSHAGIMIYTVSGTEGSFGGIVTLIERGGLNQLFVEALEKSKFCTNDPVCINEDTVCFSCSFLPETSCESFNMLLDRSFIIDDEFGFNSIMASGRKR